jgi:drug/metabolite transporter (DMT)-like permease
MANGVQTTIAGSRASARAIFERKELGFVKRGLATALGSGMLWGLDGVILGIALAMAPFTAGATIYAAPLAGSALHDGFAGLWLAVYNLFTGRWKDLGRSLKTFPGMIVCLAALLGGPIGMGAYLLGINFAGAAYAMGISACYPVIGAIMARVVLKEKIGARVWLGIFTCVVGAIILGYVPPEGGEMPNFYLGIACAALAAFGWGTEGVLATFGMDMVDPAVAINIREGVSCLVSVVAVLPFVAGLAIFGQALLTVNVVWIIALAGLAGGFSCLLWYKAFSMCGCSRCMALNITYAIWGIVFSFFMTDVAITTNLVVGAIVITVGAILVVGNPKEMINLRAEA